MFSFIVLSTGDFMDLSMYQKEVLHNYKSNTQIIRVLSEAWFNKQMYCPNCLNDSVKSYPNNQKGSDFYCEKCKNNFQLKSSKKEFKRKVVDGEYFTMMNIISENNSPSFFLLNYNSSDWHVKNLIIIPRFFMNTSMIEKRKPLSENAKRAGWIGCNFLLDNLSSNGKINVIKDEKVVDKKKVNNIWKKMFFMNTKKPEFRGWTSDILKCVEELDRNFKLNEIYSYEKYLKELHPENNNVQAKIRQQLQILRDNNLLKFNGKGEYQKRF